MQAPGTYPVKILSISVEGSAVKNAPQVRVEAQFSDQSLGIWFGSLNNTRKNSDQPTALEITIESLRGLGWPGTDLRSLILANLAHRNDARAYVAQAKNQNGEPAVDNYGKPRFEIKGFRAPGTDRSLSAADLDAYAPGLAEEIARIGKPQPAARDAQPSQQPAAAQSYRR